MSEKETQLVEAAGMKPCQVLTRRPLTIALERHFYLPGLFTGVFVFAIAYKYGFVPALAAAGVAALALTVSLIAHECGHLLLGRRVEGITPRMLLMRSSGGASIVEGRYGNARGAALFASGGPLATLAVTVAYIVAGLLLPAGPFATALLLPAVLNLMLLGVNLLPVAPMDGYMLFRSALWASVGSRAEAERRAIRWSRCVVVYGLALSLLVLYAAPKTGMLALFLVAVLAVQHRAASRQLAAARRTR